MAGEQEEVGKVTCMSLKKNPLKYLEINTPNVRLLPVITVLVATVVLRRKPKFLCAS